MRIRRSASAFTLLEIMIVVTLIGVLAAIAIPNFHQSVVKTQARACIANLKSIDMAKAQWMADAKKEAAAMPADADLFGEDKSIREKPSCPAGGTYTLGAAGAKPVCSVPGHSF
jgi:prepilin-type N-terminal cleavage/methylation domain-containing protein